jgi:hypothetical protein
MPALKEDKSMGYKTDHPDRWEAKHEATPEQRAQMGELLDRTPKWHKRAFTKASSYCTKLGYDRSAIQSPAEWLGGFANELLSPEHWSERRSISQLSTLSLRRSDRILFSLYILAQHARLQFRTSSDEERDPDYGSPFEELRGNHHNLDHLLLQMVCHLCGYQDARLPASNDLLARLVRTLAGWHLGPTLNSVSPNMVARWAAVADRAAGIAPRSIDRLRKTWLHTEANAHKDLHKRAMRHFRAAWAAKVPAATWMFALVCASDAYVIHAGLKLVRHLLLHV